MKRRQGRAKSVKVKICGLTNKEDALDALHAGCDALGFIFYKRSPRYILPARARRIIQALKGPVLRVGVFVNAREETVKRIARTCGLDTLQFHGKETPSFCRRFTGYKVIKAFRVRELIRPEEVCRYKTFACLFDSHSDKRMGGTGRVFDWRLLRNVGSPECEVFLSGGLNERNVRAAISCAGPDWVDASSSLEVFPGKKDSRRVRSFIRRAKQR
ncbi:MAG: phosphoribosylanthranilate isomerase [Candidatus Omnitrophica bacterium]|nr:phosphoribosylanthranilate isomerase [Candidatus Omnitrophota bacterium]